MCKFLDGKFSDCEAYTSHYFASSAEFILVLYYVQPSLISAIVTTNNVNNSKLENMFATSSRCKQCHTFSSQ